MNMQKNRLILIMLLLLSTQTFSECIIKDAFPNLSFNFPVFITHSGDGSNRLFVIEKRGIIKVFQNNAGTSSSSTFLDIRSKIAYANGEQGLLGLAFHPNYSSNRFFYTYYTEVGTRNLIISRFTANINDP